MFGVENFEAFKIMWLQYFRWFVRYDNIKKGRLWLSYMV